MKKNLIIIFAIVILIFSNNHITVASNEESFVLSSSGDIFYVGGTGPGNYTKIQDAVNDAQNGSTVFVYSGVYQDGVAIDKSINLVGEDKNTTIIDRGGSGGSAVYIVCDHVNVTGFKLMTRYKRSSAYIPGIRVYSNFNNIYNNNISENGKGIELKSKTNNNTINNNLFYNNIWFGGSPSHGYGILLSGSSKDNVISNNYFNSNHYGILLEGSRNMFLNNRFYNDGIYTFEPGTDNVFSGNLVNDKPFVYLYGVSDEIIDGYAGQVFLVNCDNITVKNNEINNTVSAVTLINSYNCKILDNEFANSLNECIAIVDSEDNEVQGNTIPENKHGNAIVIYRADNNLIKNNNFQKSEWGVYMYKSDYVTLNDNNIIKNTRRSGMYISYSNNLVFTNNNISENKADGIFIKESENCEFRNNIFYDNGNGACGIYIYGLCKDFILENNLFDSNNKYGIMLFFSDYIDIKNNIFCNNDIGLYIHHSNKNLITKNNFINNNISCSFEYDYTALILRTKWRNNYYDDLETNHVITGFFGIWKDYGHWGLSKYPAYRVRIPWFNFDWASAKNPHDIDIGGHN